ncbi:MAG: translation elongation factor Ts [Alphaproteobacteria bacterium]
MAEITATLVKGLREKTGAGMMDCKNALVATNGDLEAAIDWLRKKGLAAAAKKVGRITAEGLVGIALEAGKGAVVEVNCETDFVARDEAFQALVRDVGRLALELGPDVETLKGARSGGGEERLVERIAGLIAKIGENITLRRAAVLTVREGVVASYVHGALAPGLGRIGVLVALESSVPADKLEPLGHHLAMQVAAARPEAVSCDDLDLQALARERAVLREQARASGKPEAAVEKMVEGRLKKYYQQVVLLEQLYIVDGDRKVAKVLEEAAKELGATVQVGGFMRFAVGEGIERPRVDFAADVAAQATGRPSPGG